jgi:hypothetical protein
MPKQVLLVRGGALSSNTGIGGAHHNLATSLAEGEISGWSTPEVCEYPLRRRMNPLSRLYKRWFSHPRKVDKKTRGEHGLSLLHITDQEQAHLIPENCSLPVVVTVHDLFHLYPQQIRIGDETIDVGEQKPGWFRRKDLQKLRDGLSRANLLVCDSQATLSACKQHFPAIKSVCVPLGLRVQSFHSSGSRIRRCTHSCSRLYEEMPSAHCRESRSSKAPRIPVQGSRRIG